MNLRFYSGGNLRELIEILHIIGFSQGVFLGFVLISKRENHVANTIISTLVIVFAIQMLGRYFFMKDISLPAYAISFFAFPSLMLYGPLIYFYTATMTKAIERPKMKDAVHLIPFGLALIFHTTINIIHPPKLVSFNEFVKSMLMQKPAIVIYIGLAAMAGLIYTVKSLTILKRYAEKIKEYYSDIHRLNLHWLKNLLGLMIVFFITWNMLHWFRFFVEFSPRLFVIAAVFSVLIVFTVAFFVIRQPDLFGDAVLLKSILGDDLDYETDENDKPKYEKHSLDEVTAKRHLHKLQSYMEDDKPYLNDSITLKDLADTISIASHHLSIVINSYLNQNFYTFINSYRIEEAKKYLNNPEYNEKSILEIAYDSGFNSKSTFNHMFKKFTDLTPTEFRKKTAV